MWENITSSISKYGKRLKGTRFQLFEHSGCLMHWWDRDVIQRISWFRIILVLLLQLQHVAACWIQRPPPKHESHQSWKSALLLYLRTQSFPHCLLSIREASPSLFICWLSNGVWVWDSLYVASLFWLLFFEVLLVLWTKWSRNQCHPGFEQKASTLLSSIFNLWIHNYVIRISRDFVFLV